MHIVDKPGAVQSRLIVGVPVIDPSHPDWIPLSVTNTLLGGYFSSRITSNIREAKGYTYSPGSGITAASGDAYWAEFADVTTAVTGASLKEIFYEIDRLAGGSAAGGGTRRGEELPGGHLRVPELAARRHHQPSCSSSTCTACPTAT